MRSPATRSREAASRPPRTRRRLLTVTSLGLAGLLAGLLGGCGTGSLPTTASTTSFAEVAGNWQFSSTAAAAAHLSTLGGSLAVNGSSVTATLHPLTSSNQCLATSAVIVANGSISEAGLLTLKSTLPGGDTLTLSGTLAADHRSLTAATYSVTGGPCAFTTAPAPSFETASLETSSPRNLAPRDGSVPVTAQQYQPVSGTYAGTLTTADGETFALTSTVTQTSQPDADGVYHLQGTASSPGNTCLPASLPATASTVDGGSLSATYTDASGTSITAAATSSPDGLTITISSWTISSPCGSDTGTGTLTRQ